MTDKPRTWTLYTSETDPPIITGIGVGQDQHLEPPTGITAVRIIELEPVLELLEGAYAMGDDEWDESDVKDRTRALLHEHGRLE